MSEKYQITLRSSISLDARKGNFRFDNIDIKLETWPDLWENADGYNDANKSLVPHLVAEYLTDLLPDPQELASADNNLEYPPKNLLCFQVFAGVGRKSPTDAQRELCGSDLIERRPDGTYRRVIPCRYVETRELLETPETSARARSTNLKSFYEAYNYFLNQLRREWKTKGKKPGEVNKIRMPKWAQYAGRLEHDIKLRWIWTKNLPSLKCEITDTVQFIRNAEIEYTGALPIPPFDGKDSEHRVALFDSEAPASATDDVVRSVNTDSWSNLQALTRLLRGGRKQRILLQGAPGIGKEVFARAIQAGAVNMVRPPMYGAPQRKEDKSRKTPERKLVLSLADFASVDDIQKVLFGESEGKFEIPGLVQSADGEYIFLDEFDKVTEKTAGFYAMLLRVLENDEYRRFNSDKVEELPALNWIFGGSFSAGPKSTDDKTTMPKDIWSRLSGHVEIESPIRDRYIVSLFLLFHFLETLSHFGIDAPPGRKGQMPVGYRRIVASRLLFGKDDFPDTCWLPKGKIICFGQEFAKLFKEGVGVRVVRQAALAASRSLRRDAIQQGEFYLSWQVPEANTQGEKDNPYQKALREAESIIKILQGPSENAIGDHQRRIGVVPVTLLLPSGSLVPIRGRRR